MKTYTLITGASSGIGRELALLAAFDGHNLVLVARRKAALNKLAKEIEKVHKVKVTVIASDLSKSGSAEKLAKNIAGKKIKVGQLINNAGFGDYGNFASSSLPTQQSMIQLNITTLTELTHLLLPQIKKTDGKIMNVGSVASFIPGPLMSVYFASKAYVLSFSEALAEELRDSGVTITCLCPGSTKTDFGSSANVNETHSTKTSKITALEVAKYGWQAMQEGKVVAVHGAANKVSTTLVRFLPRFAVRRLVHKIQK